MKAIKYLMMFLFLTANIAYSETITVVDLMNRTVQISLPVNKIFLVNSADLQTLDIVSGDRYFDHITGWGDTIKQFFPDIEEVYAQKYPSLKNIPLVGKNAMNFNAESIINLKPDMVIARNRYYTYFKETGMLNRLDDAEIKVIFIDFRYQTIENTLRSITLLGKLLENNARAEKFTDWYSKKMHAIENNINLISDKSSVLLEKNAGLMGQNAACCEYYGAGSIGSLLNLAGGNNLLAGIAPKDGGSVNLETLLTLNPQYYILSGADWTRYNKSATSIVMGYNKNKDTALKQLKLLTKRQSLPAFPAIESQRVMAVYHGFYDSPLNILLVEAMARFLNPEIFTDLDPTADLKYFHDTFLSVAANGTFWLTL